MEEARIPVADLPTGPKDAFASTVLSVEEEAVIVAFRRHTQLPPDDGRYAPPPTIPRLTRSSGHRCLQRHAEVSKGLPQVEGEASPKRKFKAYPIGPISHIDIAEVSRTAEGKLYLLVAIDRTLEVRLCRNSARRSRGATPQISCVG